MSILSLPKHAIAFSAAVAFLAACSGGGSALQTGSLPQIQGTSAANSAPAPATLLYVTNGSTKVNVYTYPALKLKRTLGGFHQTQGACADQKGNVWITDYGAQKMLEYAHGAAKPIATLKLADFHSPFACSVDLKTGDLAVSSSRGGSGPGYVSIYKKASGQPKIYSYAKFFYARYVGYDDKGNLFVDGTDSKGAFGYAELPKGKANLVAVPLKTHIGYPGDLQFDGKYVALGDQESTAIYQIAGAKVVSKTLLTGALQTFEFAIAGKQIVSADNTGASVEVRPYPAGGASTSSVSMEGPTGVALGK